MKTMYRRITFEAENAVSFREYIENVEERRREDLKRYEKAEERYKEDRKETERRYEKAEERYREERKESEKRYKEDRQETERRYEKAEERYREERKEAEKRYTEAQQERVREYKNLRNFIIGAIVTPIIIAILVFVVPFITNNGNNLPPHDVVTQVAGEVAE